MEVLFQLFTLVMLLAGCLSGIRRGITGQLGSLTGTVFGIVASGLLWRDTALWIARTWPLTASRPPVTIFLPAALACALIFFGAYLLLMPLGPALRIIMRPLGKGPLNAVCGAVWGVVKWAVIMSFFFNILIGADHSSSLMTASMHGDGNISTGVLLLAPALTGAPDCDELAYRIQLMEAREFDRNHRHRPVVR